MTSPDLAIAEPEVCPYLGLPDDPRSRFTFADPAHRCHVGAKPTPIDLGHQGAYCLTTGYPACRRFRLPRTAGRFDSSPVPSSGVTIAATVSRDGGTIKGRSRALRPAAALLVVLALVMLIGVLGVGAIGRFMAGGGAHAVAASPSTATTPAPTTVTSASTAVTTDRGRGRARPPPPASPDPHPRFVSIIHLVVSGETLTSIAAHYGVTAKAIQDANKIVDPNLIRVGDRLVIPPPP